MAGKKRFYYCSIFYLLLRLVVATIPIVFAGTIGYFFYLGLSPLNKIAWHVLVTGFSIGLPILLISTLVYIWLYPVMLTENGIVGHNSRGRKRQLAWQEIIYVGKIRNNGFPCHKLQSNAADDYLLIPTFLSRFDRFSAELKSHGVDLSAPSTPPVKTAPARSRKRPRPNIEPRREGRYIIISTEREI